MLKINDSAYFDGIDSLLRKYIVLPKRVRKTTMMMFWRCLLRCRITARDVAVICTLSTVLNMFLLLRITRLSDQQDDRPEVAHKMVQKIISDLKDLSNQAKVSKQYLLLTSHERLKKLDVPSVKDRNGNATLLGSIGTGLNIQKRNSASIPVPNENMAHVPLDGEPGIQETVIVERAAPLLFMKQDGNNLKIRSSNLLLNPNSSIHSKPIGKYDLFVMHILAMVG